MGIKLSKPKLHPALLNDIVAESLMGKGIGRILMNHALSKVAVSGKIIDLGAGTASASYNRFIKFVEPYKIICTDFYQSGEDLIKLDLEHPFDLADSSYDNIFCFNVLEHVYNYPNLISESLRILKPGGKFIGATPFICDYHPSPNDYFRYSPEALVKMFEEFGFKLEQMTFLGLGPFTAGFSQWGNLMPNRHLFKALKLVLLAPHLLADVLLEFMTKKFQYSYPLGYLYTFIK